MKRLAAIAATALPMIAHAGPDTRPVAETIMLDGIWGVPVRWEALRARIGREVGPCRIWHYNSSGMVSLETLGRQLADELKKSNGPVNLIGFSMGGLIIREALRVEPELNARRVIFLHSPHGGSLNGHLLPLPACREMRPGSAFLLRLDAAEWERPTLVTWCPWDLMVFPGHSARWNRATRSIRSDVPAHDWPVWSPGIHAEVIEFLQNDPPTE